MQQMFRADDAPTEISFALIQALAEQPREIILAAIQYPRMIRDLAVALQKRRARSLQ